MAPARAARARRLSASRSSAYSRIVSSRPNRGSPSPPSHWRTRLLSTSEAIASSAAPIGSCVRARPRRRPRASSRRRRRRAARAALCSGGVEQVVAPLDRVAQRALPLGQVAGAAGEQVEALSPSRARIACGDSSFTRAAASSIASGSPSSRRQISSTASRFSSVSSKLGFTRLRALDEELDAPRRGLERRRRGSIALLAQVERRLARREHASGPARRRAARGRARRRAAPARSCRARAAPARRRAPARASRRAGRRATPRRRARARSPSRRASGSGRRREVDEGGLRDVAGELAARPRSRAASCPVPPRPVSVTSRASGRRASSSTAASSAARPISGVGSAGRSARRPCAAARLHASAAAARATTTAPPSAARTASISSRQLPNRSRVVLRERAGDDRVERLRQLRAAARSPPARHRAAARA